MMRCLRLLRLVWRSLVPGIGISITSVLGFAVAGGTLAGVSSMVSGLEAALMPREATSSPRLLIQREGAPLEAASRLMGEEAYVGIETDGVHLRSPELAMRLFNHPLGHRDAEATLLVRGVTENGFELRPDIRIVTGRTFNPGRNEAIIGTSALRMFPDLQIGRTLVHKYMHTVEWKIVGVFAADGYPHDSEVWVDLVTAQQLYSGGTNMISGVWVTLTEDGSIKGLATDLAQDPRYPVEVRTEDEVLAARRGPAVNRLNALMYSTVFVFLTAATVIAACSTMTIVAQCMPSLHTLALIGFGVLVLGGSVACIVATIAVTGTVAGILFVEAVFDGMAASTTDGASLQTSFLFDVDWRTAFVLGSGVVLVTMCAAFAAGPLAVGSSLPKAMALRRAGAE